MKSLFLGIAVLLNLIFGSQFIFLSYKIRKQMKNHVYSHNSFREIDEKAVSKYIGLAIVFIGNVIVLLGFTL